MVGKEERKLIEKKLEMIKSGHFQFTPDFEQLIKCLDIELEKVRETAFSILDVLAQSEFREAEYTKISRAVNTLEEVSEKITQFQQEDGNIHKIIEILELGISVISELKVVSNLKLSIRGDFVRDVEFEKLFYLDPSKFYSVMNLLPITPTNPKDLNIPLEWNHFLRKLVEMEERCFLGMMYKVLPEEIITSDDIGNLEKFFFLAFLSSENFREKLKKVKKMLQKIDKRFNSRKQNPLFLYNDMWLKYRFYPLNDLAVEFSCLTGKVWRTKGNCRQVEVKF